MNNKKDTYILGINTGHNCTAAVLKNGEIIACISEERLNGIKNSWGFPTESIKWCLNFAKIKSKDLDYVAFPFLFTAPTNVSSGTKSYVGISILSFFYLTVEFIRKIWGRTAYYIPSIRPIGTFFYWLATEIIGKYTSKKEKKFIAKYLGIPLEKVINFDHHLVHAAAGYYSSKYNQSKALVFALDGEGDRLCATVEIFEGTNIKRIASTKREDSIGWIYHYVTKYLGMKPQEHEYKVMGLAAYSKKEDTLRVYEKIKNIIVIDPKNHLKFKAKFNTQDTTYYLKKNMDGFRFDNIAGAFQKLLEDKVLQWVDNAIKETKITTVIFSGGVFMNVKLNQKIASLKKVENCFFMPSCGDESNAIGACYLAYINREDGKNKNHDINPIRNLYLGPSFSNAEVSKLLNSNNYPRKYKVEKVKNIELEIAKLLADGNIVARLSGRMEFGARALGNRSILADPRNYDVARTINEYVKNRDFWMPFAASILDDRVDEYIINPKNLDANYMMVSFDSTEKARKDLKAGMHQYDFTIRPQVVRKDFNPKYYQLIKEFERLTGVGGVLNTSFNLHGNPIVFGPKEALSSFDNSGLTHLAIEDYLISKKK